MGTRKRILFPCYNNRQKASTSSKLMSPDGAAAASPEHPAAVTVSPGRAVSASPDVSGESQCLLYSSCDSWLRQVHAEPSRESLQHLFKGGWWHCGSEWSLKTNGQERLAWQE